jgi:hypothetical protein
MNVACRTVSRITLWAALAGTAAAQAPVPSHSDAAPPHPTALSEAGEPRANTSNGETAPPAAVAGPAGAAGTAAAGKASGGPRAAKAAKAATAAGGAAPAKSAATDRLDLGLATVTGDREQPKVMYVVPWKRSDIGDLSGKPMNSLLDEALAPVDRDEFKREVIYYQAVQGDASQNGASKTAAKGEK